MGLLTCLMEENMKDVMIIGIAGGSGSGKTTLAQRIKDVFGRCV